MTRRPRPRVVRQWTWLLTGMIAATALASFAGILWRADLGIYDAALPQRAAPDDVVIVAIDDASIAALGRWPWPRSVHAQLMDRLTAAGARAVAFDILFIEPDAHSPGEDAALTAAIARGPPTVLPLAVEMPAQGRAMRVLPPIPELARAAAAVGHVHLELDRDGVGRSVFLREGPGATSHAHLMLALLEHAPGEARAAPFGARAPDAPIPAGVWARDYQMLIPFLGPPGHFRRVSYADVLSGAASAEALRGKLVLVGLTAQGTGDAYPTPRSGEGVAMPGVEISANVLQALRDARPIRPLGRVASAVLAVVPIVLVAIGFLRLSPRRALVLTAVTWLLTLVASVAALRMPGWWWPPAAPLAALLVMYPLWSWRRLEATQAYLDEELAWLSREHFPFALPTRPARQLTRFADDVERRLTIVREAAQRARDARRLFSDTLEALPGATILTDNDGRIVIANPAAAQLLGTVAAAAGLEGTPLDDCLAARSDDPALRFAALARHAPETRESALRPDTRNVLVRTVAFDDAAGARAGTIVEITDISELRAAQREREEALRFLSHDMKSPASSLLSLAQLQRDAQRALPADALAERLDTLAQRLLALVDGFVGLARAEAADPRAFEPFDLRDAIQDALDEVWAVAQSRRIAIEAELPAEASVVHGDRALVARALINLVSNALKFSASPAVVIVRMRQDAADAVVAVEDHGPGIAEESRAALFQRFSRRVHRGEVDPGGAGLGLAFVRVVAEKHGGRAWMEAAPAGGAIFAIALPVSPPGAST